VTPVAAPRPGGPVVEELLDKILGRGWYGWGDIRLSTQ
jgi:hypothetical protein